MKKCGACTYENKPNLTICDMCGSVLQDLPNQPSAPGQGHGRMNRVRLDSLKRRPASVTSMASIKQESELMDQLREIEEAEAKEMLQGIVKFCKDVSSQLYTDTSRGR